MVGWQPNLRQLWLHNQLYSVTIGGAICLVLWLIQLLVMTIQEQKNSQFLVSCQGGPTFPYFYKKCGSRAQSPQRWSRGQGIMLLICLLILIWDQFRLRLDYKGLQPGMAAQPAGIPEQILIEKIDSCTIKTHLNRVEKQNLWVQCETPELRFSKRSIKWDDLTIWFFQVYFCFPPPFFLFLGEHNSLVSILPPLLHLFSIF